MRANVDADVIAATAKTEQREIEALEERARELGRLVVQGKDRAEALDRVAELARHMAGRLEGLDQAGQLVIVNSLDLRASFKDPKDPDSPILITSTRNVGALADGVSWPDGAPSSTEA